MWCYYFAFIWISRSLHTVHKTLIHDNKIGIVDDKRFYLIAYKCYGLNVFHLKLIVVIQKHGFYIIVIWYNLDIKISCRTYASPVSSVHSALGSRVQESWVWTPRVATNYLRDVGYKTVCWYKLFKETMLYIM